MALRRDVRALPAAYRALHDALATVIPRGRLLADPLRTFAYGTDASFYRLVPKLVVVARSEDEVRAVLREAERHVVPITFRAAGTSLSGQAVTDHVLVVLAGGWQAARVHPTASASRSSRGSSGRTRTPSSRRSAASSAPTPRRSARA